MAQASHLAIKPPKKLEHSRIVFGYDAGTAFVLENGTRLRRTISPAEVD